ncbi:hypothetical protein EV356DRAFT_457005 [Viridothelium virens]|uniref:Uncharacterized protein n=1 Tax=Viridothelium virens TaxID=1048519 RepID=A0A6A6GSQ6_VIRVR|nr:hypothetical protein EV356DRAFT_457005 [Viridothelium virens]
MCDYTQVEYQCGHIRYVVKAWCIKYQMTHKRCPANVVAIEYRLNEKCGRHKQNTAKLEMTLRLATQETAGSMGRRSLLLHGPCLTLSSVWVRAAIGHHQE